MSSPSSSPGAPAAPAASVSDASDRPLRTDARRNRDNLVEVARAAFAASDDTVPLEGIARSAGVGIGTLYRHFPTRESLVEAVYAAELDGITASARELLDRLPADAALRAWFSRYGEFVAAKRGMLNTLRAGWASGRITGPTTRERVTGTIELLLAAGIRSGTLRADVAADDVTAMLLGVFLSTAANGSPEQVGRLLDLVVDSLRVGR